MNLKWTLFALFAFLWVGDIVATMRFVSVLGIETEANPFIKDVIASSGMLGFVIIKLGVLSFWITLVERTHWLIHLILVIIMVPVVYMGFIVASSTL